MPSFVGPWEIILLVLVLLLIFGPKRVPEIGRSLGKGMREFKDSVTGKENEPQEHASLPVAPPSEPVSTSQSREHDTV
jgi:sec-independent protein translocase protein TatA